MVIVQRELPRGMDDVLTRNLLKSDIASGKHVKYERMVDHTRIHEDDLLTVCIDGQQRKAIQWVGIFHHARKAGALRGIAEERFGSSRQT